MTSLLSNVRRSSTDGTFLQDERAGEVGAFETHPHANEECTGKISCTFKLTLGSLEVLRLERVHAPQQ